MVPALALALLSQVPGLQVSAVADRDRALVGDEVAVTIRATSGEQDPIRFLFPSFDGFELVSQAETSEIIQGNRPRRSAILELRLRVLRAGQLSIWPIRVQQRFQVVVVPRLEVQAEGDDTPPGGGTAGLPRNPEVQRLIRLAPPPRSGDVRIATVLSTSSAVVGEQVDLATAAWFPRSVLARLRRPPTLKPPSLDGVWSLPQPVTPGVVSSRLVGGEWYDLFVSHQVFFPLTPGTVVVPSATLTFSLPVGRQFFSEGRQVELESQPETLSVRPRPGGGSPASPTAHRLSIQYEMPQRQAYAGELVGVGVALEGEGNVALWPEPVVTWPQGLRAYDDRVEDEPDMRNGRAGGRKRFRYNLLVDSAGPLILPEVEYTYFDAGAGRFRTARTPPASIPVAPRRVVAIRRTRPILGYVPARPPLVRVWDRIFPWGVGLLFVLPLLGWAGRVASVARRRRASGPPEGDHPDLTSFVRQLVPEHTGSDRVRLARSLRQRGVPPTLAGEVAQALEEEERIRYGPRLGGTTMPGQGRKGDLVARLRQVIRPGVLLLLGSLVVSGDLHAAQTGDSLYHEGEVRAALIAYQREAGQFPDSAALWYRVGVAAYALGEDAVAAGALRRARELAPRSAVVRVLWDRLRDSTRGRLNAPVPTAPVAPEEVYVAALLLWIIGWIWVLSRRKRRRLGWVVIGLGLAAVWLGTRLENEWAVAGGFVKEATPIRVAPHGLAEARGRAEALEWVRMTESRAGWWKVRSDLGLEGWLTTEAVAVVPRGRR